MEFAIGFLPSERAIHALLRVSSLPALRCVSDDLKRLRIGCREVGSGGKVGHYVGRSTPNNPARTTVFAGRFARQSRADTITGSPRLFEIGRVLAQVRRRSNGTG